MFISRAAVCQPLIKRVPDIVVGAENIAEKNEAHHCSDEAYSPVAETGMEHRLISNWYTVRNCNRYFKGKNAGERGGTGSSRACGL